MPTATTRYSARGFAEYSKIAYTIAEISNKVPGNVAVFFPSFEILEAVYELLKGKVEKQFFVQKKRMNAKERSELIDSFRKSRNGLLLAVAAGIFAEGIDFIGEQLLAAIIVGVPLAEMDLEQKCLIEYYEQKFGSGWRYAYIYPAIVRALQAAGRVIRDRDDKGVIVFIDKRYLWRNYAHCLPKDMHAIVTNEPERYIEAFWRKHNFH